MATRTVRAITFGLALGLAVPAVATGDTAADAKDRAQETTARAKRKARAAKPGGESASDRWADTKDVAHEGSAKTRRQARKAARKTQGAAKRTRDRVNDATN